MTKRIIFIIVIHFINTTLFAQWYQFFPMNSEYAFFNDTATNTSAIMKAQGIKKIMVYKNAPSQEKNSFLYTTRYLNAYGNSDTIIECIQNKKKDTSFCTTYIFSYKKNGKIEKFNLKQADGLVVLSDSTEYLSKNETKTYSKFVSVDSLKSFDSIIFHRYYNDKNELIQLDEVMNNGDFFTSQVYSYSSDGFLDSVNYKQNKNFNPFQLKDDRILFRRLKKRHQLIVYSEYFPGKYEWIYNNEKQCTKFKIFYLNPNYIPRNDESKYIIETVVEYKYNDDGTLKEIIEEKNDRPTLKLYYYYFK